MLGCKIIQKFQGGQQEKNSGKVFIQIKYLKMGDLGNNWGGLLYLLSA